MNWIDFIIIIVVLANAFFGLIEGFIWQVAGILSIVLGAGCAYIFHIPVTKLIFQRFIGNENVSKIIAFLFIFITISVVVRVIAAIFKTIIKTIRLEKLDRLAGGILGGIKGIFLCAIVIYAIVKYPVPRLNNACSKSLIAGLFVKQTDKVVSKVPPEISDRVKDFLENKKEDINNCFERYKKNEEKESKH